MTTWDDFAWGVYQLLMQGEHLGFSKHEKELFSFLRREGYVDNNNKWIKY